MMGQLLIPMFLHILSLNVPKDIDYQRRGEADIEIGHD